ncbi:MAG: hypothetical protein Kow0022_15440 [Phycisphaerales bacterium]
MTSPNLPPSRFPEPDASRTLLPNDHVRMLTELLRPCGPELARRWLAALLLVPTDQRESVVQAVEEQIVREFGC